VVGGDGVAEQRQHAQPLDWVHDMKVELLA
jgi:hypothetical protein